MDSTVISAIVALIGSLVGTFGGIVTGTKLINYRLQELEKKQDKHNAVIERTYKLEERMGRADEKIKTLLERGE